MRNKPFIIALILTALFLVCLGSFLASNYLVSLLLYRGTDMPVYLAIFNLAVDMVVGFLTVWGLIWAAQEFRDSQEKPDLDFVFLEREIQGLSENAIINMSDTKVTIAVSKIEKDVEYLNLGVLNTGTSVSIWYRLRFVVPTNLYFGSVSGKQRLAFIETFINGNNYSLNHEAGLHEFKSLGKEAAYPKDTVHICGIPFTRDNKYEKVYRIRYNIVTDKTKPKTGALTINVIQDSPEVQ